MTINSFLCKSLGLSKEKAIELITSKTVFINALPAAQQQTITKSDTIHLKEQMLQEAKKFLYFAYYKPRGIECTLNTSIQQNLADTFPIKERVFPVGRLDKDSEGLLLLTNDGSLYKSIASSESHKEKEYEVEVATPLSEEALKRLSEGIEIMGKMTRPAQVKQLNETSFSIVLTQGLNRQIRRMCYKLGLEVTRLKRIRIDTIHISTLTPGEYFSLSESDFR